MQEKETFRQFASHCRLQYEEQAAAGTDERSGLPLAKQASSDLKVHGMDSALTNAFCSRLRDVMPGPQD